MFLEAKKNIVEIFSFSLLTLIISSIETLKNIID